MGITHKKNNCLNNIPERGEKIARPKTIFNVNHMELVNNAMNFAIIRYKKTVTELAQI